MSTEMERMHMVRAEASGNVVRVVVPADVYFSLDKLQKVQKAILGRLGHPGCHSGWDIRLDVERYFHVDAELNVRSEVRGF